MLPEKDMEESLSSDGSQDIGSEQDKHQGNIEYLWWCSGHQRGCCYSTSVTVCFSVLLPRGVSVVSPGRLSCLLSLCSRSHGVQLAC